MPKKANLPPPSIAFSQIIIHFQQRGAGLGITASQPVDTKFFRAYRDANAGRVRSTDFCSALLSIAAGHNSTVR
jgi:hypothetical protein